MCLCVCGQGWGVCVWEGCVWGVCRECGCVGVYVLSQVVYSLRAFKLI